MAAVIEHIPTAKIVMILTLFLRNRAGLYRAHTRWRTRPSRLLTDELTFLQFLKKSFMVNMTFEADTNIERHDDKLRIPLGERRQEHI